MSVQQNCGRDISGAASDVSRSILALIIEQVLPLRATNRIEKNRLNRTPPIGICQQHTETPKGRPMLSLPRFATGFFLLFSLSLSPLLGQGPAVTLDGQGRGQIRLQVSDSTGAALKASGSLVGPGRVNRSFQTDTQGEAILSDLPFGHYRVELSRGGFFPRTIEIDVTSAGAVSQQISMTVQGASTSVTVISPTPIGQADQPLDEIPVNVQGLTAKNLEDSNALDLAQLMNRRLSGVYVNDNVGNPFQPDINYRGYTASPLLGTPEGLSVYLDGVRQNQPFGDVVAWDLIPKIAIQDMALIPGSDPVYGLNTLGGAVSVQ